MNIRDYTSGKFVQRLEYQSFEPEEINHTWTWDDSELNVMLEQANKLLGELNAFSYIVPDIDLFISMHIVKEATQSSKIEGTKTEIDEALRPIEDISLEKRDDWQEVQNYIKAINWAVDELEKLPISSRLIKGTHRILLQGTRGDNKTPGEFRKSQNWIGGTNPSNAFFVPPHNESISDLIQDLEFFINDETFQVPHLIKIALAHYQFETIHPFLDGNGRIGRLLITLYLVSNKLISKPSFYISDYLERNRAFYFNSLTMVRERNDLTGWLKFFLKALIATAESSIKTFKDILILKEKYNVFISKSGQKADSIRKIINHLYRSPIADVNLLAEAIDKDQRTIRRMIDYLLKNEIVNEITGNQRNRAYALHDYLSIFLNRK